MGLFGPSKEKLEWENKGDVCLAEEKYEEAVNCYKKALDFEKWDHRVCTNMSYAHIKLGKYTEALDYCERAYKMFPNDFRTLSFLGIIFAKLGRYQEALETYDKAVTIDPQHADSWHKRGIILDKLERHKDARESYKKALSLDPSLTVHQRHKGTELKTNIQKEVDEKAEFRNIKHDIILKKNIGSKGSGDGQFRDLTSIALDAAGNVYAGDAGVLLGKTRIQKFTSDGTFITKWGSYGLEDGQFFFPRSIATDAEGNVYVGDAGNHRIQKFTSDGKFITKWGSKGSGDGQFHGGSTSDGIQGIAIDIDDNIYVADTNNYRIQKFDRNGVFITKWGSKGSEEGQFRSLTSIAVDATGNIYVAEAGGTDLYSSNHRIQKFTSIGTFISKWGSKGSGDGQFYFPRSIAVDAVGNVYVGDAGNHRIQKFDETGKFITKWGSEGKGEGQFISLQSIAVDAAGNLYVADKNNYRIQKFEQPNYIKSLIIASINRDGHSRQGAIDALFNIGQPTIDLLVQIIIGGSSESKRAVTPLFLKFGAPAIDSLIKTTNKNNISNIPIEPFIQALNNDDPEVRKYAAEALGRIGNQKAFLPLKKALNDTNEEVRITAVKALKPFGEARKPQVSINLSTTNLTANHWQKIDATLQNTGQGEANTIGISLSDSFETKKTTIQSLKPGGLETIEIPIRPKYLGSVPLTISLTYTDEIEQLHTIHSDFWIDVIDRVSGTSTPSPVAGFTPQPQTPTTFPLELANKYTDVSLIGKGGFGRVFRATRQDGTEVAVKIPLSIDAATGKSFIAELQSWTRLSHPNIVRLYDYNIMPIPYFEMEYCSDGSLADKAIPMEPRDAAWIIFSICEGLKVAHNQQIIHRDLKPHNILMRNGIPKVSDWGLAKMLTLSKTSTSASFTPHYAAPEQISNTVKDERTDIWQMGVIFYELVTGELPFEGENMMSIMFAITSGTPTRPREIVPDAAPVEGVILKCLEKETKNRYQSIFELQRELARYLEMNYTEELKKSVTAGNVRRAAYYCGELVLTALHTGDLKSAYKYLQDLLVYAKGDVKDDVQSLADTLQFMVENEMEVSEDILMKADLLVHRMRGRG
ncbi:protein kinase [Methanocalculus taiwanensis]|uniref:Protein kinase n=1 Tax=Methanocalculus taiwanensis TaxID=106207 RepID=A0ABD4TNT2_9EURY|nr:protein kinase [Methanocalculus taiwanensis]MCQ1539515.1 protein kinase [Methanocalculus taiwanensis]